MLLLFATINIMMVSYVIGYGKIYRNTNTCLSLRIKAHPLSHLAFPTFEADTKDHQWYGTECTGSIRLTHKMFCCAYTR